MANIELINKINSFTSDDYGDFSKKIYLAYPDGIASFGELDILVKCFVFSKESILIKKRLLSAKSCLKKWIKDEFKNYRYDKKHKCLIGSNGYILQWAFRDKQNQPISYNNQQTLTGCCIVYKIED